MPRYKGTNYFVVKHDLASLQLFPGRIWNSDKSKPSAPPPRGFKQVLKGDCWIAFAYTKGDAKEKAVSEVTGFYECVSRQPSYEKLPARVSAKAGAKCAWVLEGKVHCRKLEDPVGIPSLGYFLGKGVFHRRTVLRISKKQFLAIKRYVLAHRFKDDEIPGLGRQPRNEQEVLAIVAAAPERFGIEAFVRVQTRFPDMTVKLKRKADAVHLELELHASSFLNHDHARQIRNGRFSGSRKSPGDKCPVGVLCWIDDDRGDEVSRHVQGRVFELRDLLIHNERIRW